MSEQAFRSDTIYPVVFHVIPLPTFVIDQIIETANAPIFGINSSGLVNEWNQTEERITGFK